MLVFQDSLLSVSVFKYLYLLVSCFPIVFLYIVTNMFHIWEGRTRKLESLWWIMETSFGNQVWTAKFCLTATKHTKIHTVPLQTQVQVVWIDDGGLWAPWAGPQTWPKTPFSFMVAPMLFFWGQNWPSSDEAVDYQSVSLLNYQLSNQYVWILKVSLNVFCCLYTTIFVTVYKAFILKLGKKHCDELPI